MGKLLERITSLIAAGSALLIGLSVSHELGYFSHIGLFYLSFVSATDYFTNAILWLPLAAITGIGWQMNWRFIWDDTPKLKFKSPKTWIVPSVIVSIPLLFFMFTDGFPLFYWVLFLYLWVLLFDFIVPMRPGSSDLTIELRRLTRLAIPVGAALFTIGYQSALSDMKSTSSPYLILVKDDKYAMLKIPLRNFDRGVLFHNPMQRRVEFIKWDRLEALSKPTFSNESADPPSCKLFGWRCIRPTYTP